MNGKYLTTYCGIYCGDCPRYKAEFSDMCSGLVDEFDNSHFSKLAKVIATKNSKFRNYDEMLSLLKTIADLKCDVPCRSGGGKGDACEVIVCNKVRKGGLRASFFHGLNSSPHTSALFFCL